MSRRLLYSWAVGAMLGVGPLWVHAETRILFTSSRQTANGTHELYSMDVQGSNIIRITHNDVSEWGPALAPDGRRIAYVATNLTLENIFITDLGGRDPVAVGNTNRALAVQWGDTNTLYYLAQEGVTPPIQTYTLWRIGADGSGQTRVYTNVFQTWPLGAETFFVDWTAQRVHLTTFSPGYSLLVSGSLAANSPDTVLAGVPPLRDHYNPATFSGSAALAFCADMTNQPGSHRLYLGSTAGGPALQVSDTFCGSPAWAPDGSWLAFARAPASTFGMRAYLGDIWRVATNGSGLVNLTTNTPVQGACGFPTVYEESEPRLSSFSAAGGLTWENGLARPVTRIQQAGTPAGPWASRWLTTTSLTASVALPDAGASGGYRLQAARGALLAWYPLTNDFLDRTGHQIPLSYSNAPFAGGGVYCNGIAPSADPLNGCFVLLPTTAGLDFSNVLISIQFMVTNYPALQRPVFMGGGISWRWAGVYLDNAGQVGLCFNNVEHYWSSQTVQSNTWHEAALVYDGAGQVCEVYLDGTAALTHTGAMLHGGDASWAMIHFGNSQAFQGYLRHLRIYNMAKP